MVDIYNEAGYIRYIIENGLSSCWKRDSSLLAKYYRVYEGLSREECDFKISEKIDNRYGKDASKTKLYRDEKNNIINSVYDSKTKKEDINIREIAGVKISTEIIEWFKSLLEYTITDEKVAELRKLYGNSRIGISNKIFDYNRVKFLFVLYIWNLVQHNYVKSSDQHDLKQLRRRFLKDCKFRGTFKFESEIQILKRLGFISIHNKQNKKINKWEEFIAAEFIHDDMFDESLGSRAFSVTEWEEREKCTGSGDSFCDGYVILMNDNEIELKNDLHNPGYWFDKYYYGVYTCERCGKEFPKYGKRGDNAKKLCSKCSAEIRAEKNKNRTVVKLGDGEHYSILCECCGKWVPVKKMDRSSTRCDKCQENEDKRLHVLRQKAYRERQKYKT